MFGAFSRRLSGGVPAFSLEDLGSLIHAYYFIENGGAPSGVPNQKVGGLPQWNLLPVTTEGIIVPNATPTGFDALRTSLATTQYRTSSFAFDQPYEVFAVLRSHEFATLGMMIDGRTDVSCTIRIESNVQCDSSFGGTAIDQNVNVNFNGKDLDRFWLFHHIGNQVLDVNSFRVNNFNISNDSGSRSPDGFVIGNRGLGTQPKDTSLVALVIASLLPSESVRAQVRSTLYPTFEDRFLGIVLGDSISAGFGVAASWVASLTSAVTDRVEFLNKAVGGNTITNHILPNISTMALAYYDAGRKSGITYADFWAGTNDLFLLGLNAETVFDNMVLTASALRNTGITPIPFNCLERPASLDPVLQAQRTAFNTLLQNQYALIGPGLIDVTGVLGPSPGPDWQDGIHPSQAGIDKLTSIRIEPGHRTIMGI